MCFGRRRQWEESAFEVDWKMQGYRKGISVPDTEFIIIYGSEPVYHIFLYYIEPGCNLFCTGLLGVERVEEKSWWLTSRAERN
jgi:hypothetical protein